MAMATTKQNNFNFSGRIFFDQNQNQLMEHNDFGLGGVRLTYGDNQVVYSNAQGGFSIRLKTNIDYIKINIDKESLPPGSILIGPSSFQFHKSSGVIHNLNIAAKYETKKIHYSFPYRKENLTFLDIHSDEKLKISIKKNFIYINGQRWRGVEEGIEYKKTYNQNTFKFGYNLNLIRFNKEFRQVKKELTIYKDRIKKLDINLEYNSYGKPSSKQLKLIQGKLELELAKLDISKDKYQVKIISSSKNLITIQKKNIYTQQCLIDYNFREYTLNKEMVLNIQYNKERDINFYCSNRLLKLKIPKVKINDTTESRIEIKKVLNQDKKIELQYKVTSPYSFYHEGQKLDSNFIKELKVTNEQIHFNLKTQRGFSLPYTVSVIRPDFYSKKIEKEEGEVDLLISRHFESMRDDQQYLFFKTKNIKSLRVNRHKIALNKVGMGQVLVSKPGQNIVNIKAINNYDEEKEFIFKYDLYPKEKFDIQVDYGIKNRNYSSDLFSTEYTINEVYFINAQMRAFYNREWGAHISYQTDTSTIQLNTLTGDIADVVNTEVNAHLLYRWDSDAQNFHSAHYTFFVGFKTITIDKSLEDLSEPFPDDYTGLQIGVEKLNKEVFIKDLDMATQLFVSMHMSDMEYYSIDFAQEFRIGLNKIGDYIPLAKNYYTYDYQNPGYENLSLVLGIKAQMIKREVVNFENGTITELNYSASGGIKFQY